MLNFKKKKKNKKIKNGQQVSNFTILLTSLVETLPRSVHEVGEKIIMVCIYFQSICHLKLLLL